MKMKPNIVECNVEVNDVITPFSCSAMIIEFIKYIAYHKQLIPYPYERLKMYVDAHKKHSQDVDSCTRTGHLEESLASQKYFKKTAAAHESLENMFKVINDELTNTNRERVEEVVLLLGKSFTNPQDIYRLCIPRLNYNHSVKYHSSKKNWRNLFRTMINSEQFNNIVCGNCCTGNMHMLLKMKPSNELIAATNVHLYVPRAEFKLPTRGNHAVITFREVMAATTDQNEENDGNGECLCDRQRFNIFEDHVEASSSVNEQRQQHQCVPSDGQSTSLSPPSCASTTSSSSFCSSSNTTSSSSSDFGQWFQIKDTLKYFTDVTINNVSLTDSWMNPKITLD